ncbi:hypothetical protein Tsubulata_030092 [Turnera subulata]|uniref:rRNA N-glycosylase n=1 Tax=Turnera subulata TaxID=218843 RepID=A0A9Q0FTC6_9ROSI|nr:hypothetical protein Tsubulata_030092 [Turnera subulata]
MADADPPPPPRYDFSGSCKREHRRCYNLLIRDTRERLTAPERVLSYTYTEHGKEATRTIAVLPGVAPTVTYDTALASDGTEILVRCQAFSNYLLGFRRNTEGARWFYFTEFAEHFPGGQDLGYEGNYDTLGASSLGPFEWKEAITALGAAQAENRNPLRPHLGVLIYMYPEAVRSETVFGKMQYAMIFGVRLSSDLVRDILSHVRQWNQRGKHLQALYRNGNYQLPLAQTLFALLGLSGDNDSPPLPDADLQKQSKRMFIKDMAMMKMAADADR